MAQDDIDTVAYLKSKAQDVMSDYWWGLLEKDVEGGVPLEDLDEFMAEGFAVVLVAAAAVNSRDRVDKHADHDQSSHGRRGGGLPDPAANDPRYNGRIDSVRDWQSRGAATGRLVDKVVSGDPLNPAEEAALKAGMNDVYGVTVSGTSKTGEDVTVTSSVETVYANYGQVTVEGYLRNSDGDAIGRFERIFSEDMVNGGVQVSHEWLEMDPDYRGSGFGTKFVRQSEDFYISQGVSRVTVHAALEDGGYTWARAGFDWDSQAGMYGNDVGGTVLSRLDYYRSYAQWIDGPTRAQLNSYYGTMSSSDDPSYWPSPREIAQAGYAPGATQWAGKEILTGAHWYGEKILPPPPPPDPNASQQLTLPGT